jgi:thioredoxin-related protein
VGHARVTPSSPREPQTVIPSDPGKENHMFRFHSTSANKFRAQLSCLVLMAVSSAACAAEPHNRTWHRDWNSAWDASQSEGRPMLIFVTNKCCYYCEKMRTETYGNSRVVDDIQREFVPASIDSKQYPEIASKLNVRLYPTTVIIGSDGQVIATKPGYVGPEQLRSWLKTSGTKIAQR